MKKLLLTLGMYYLIVGIYILFAPEMFYLNTPGLAQMGPYNFHFIIDIGLTFIASAFAILWGAYRNVKSVTVAGAAWPFLHALFHLQIWIHREFIFDHITMADFAAVILPGFLILYLATRMQEAQ